MDERPPMEKAMSTDVVMDIVLSHLKVGDLLNCRKVSKFWNQAASLVLRKRSTMIKKIYSEAELMELEESMKQNSGFPFTGFQFDYLWMWILNSPRTQEFFKNYGDKFTSLYLKTFRTTRIQDLAPFLIHLRRLTILEMFWPPQRAELLDSPAGQEEGRILNLPSLRTLRVSYEMNQDGLGEIVQSASRSLRIECWPATYRLLSQLKSVGKLQAVSVMKTYHKYDRDDSAFGQAMFLSTESPALTKLDFSANGCVSQDGLKKILVSSQHTLKDLRLVGIYPSQFSLNCPVLTKLTTLSLCVDESTFASEYAFQGSQGNKFPALKELNLDFMQRRYGHVSGNFSDDLFIVPSLTTIDLNGRVDINVIKDLARSFPNVVEIRLKCRCFGYNPTNIWSVGAFECLEKLTIWDYPVQRPSKKYINMDRFLTGMPIAVCNNLLKTARPNPHDSPFNEILRETPSILQLKNLKELIVCVELKCALKEFPEEPPFISMVSLWYALDMMPNLEARFLYKRNSPSGRFQEKNRDKAVSKLQAAFKHVQPFVELEPFLIDPTNT